MTVAHIRDLFLRFFREKGHAIIPSASLLPENDPTVLFTTAGMHPLVPYLIGASHPAGKRLASSQKCVRTDDVDEVGDSFHLTFFEMLGNWSLGDYFKPEAIQWSFEFLTDPSWLKLDPKRLFVTVFEGDADAPRDDESIQLWQSLFLTKYGMEANVGKVGKDEPSATGSGPRIFAYPKKKNWWGPAGTTGPCGPDTEMFYDTLRPHDPSFGSMCHPNCDCGRFVEIWNDVFMQYEKVKSQKAPPEADPPLAEKGKSDNEDGFEFKPLKQKNVDTGMGLERVAAVMQNVETVFDTEVFRNVFEKIGELSGTSYRSNSSQPPLSLRGGAEGGGVSAQGSVNRAYRIIADHIRAATFIVGDERGVVPSNVGQGYIVRRLLRRAIREGRRIGIKEAFTHQLALVFVGEFGAAYPELEKNITRIETEFKKEEEKFAKSIEKGMKELEKMVAKETLNGEQAFVLFSTYGFPLELTEEIAKEKGLQIDRDAFAAEFKKHQELSRTASAGTFKGGLADHSEQTTKLHTATHLLHQALRKVLGDHVAQKGSNITAERLRFDFSHPEKMTGEQVAQVEQIVNDVIARDLPVHFEEMSVEDAKKRGAIGLFESKYGDKVKVYFVGDAGKEYSIEICGGPHVARTGELKAFKIQKEEAVSAGVRRIKAVVG